MNSITIFYISLSLSLTLFLSLSSSLSLSLTGEEGVRILASIKNENSARPHSLSPFPSLAPSFSLFISLSLSLSLTSEEGVQIQHTHTLTVPHSFSHVQACVIIILMRIQKMCYSIDLVAFRKTLLQNVFYRIGYWACTVKLFRAIINITVL